MIIMIARIAIQGLVVVVVVVVVMEEHSNSFNNAKAYPKDVFQYLVVMVLRWRFNAIVVRSGVISPTIALQRIVVLVITLRPVVLVLA